MFRRTPLRVVTVVATLGLCGPVLADTWTELGPQLGGRLDGLVADPSDPNVLMVASPGGGVWRTEKGGGDWHPTLNHGLADYSVFHLEWDRVRPRRVTSP